MSSAVPVVAQYAQPTLPSPLTALKYEDITVSNTLGGVALNPPTGAPGVPPPLVAVIDLETAEIRYTCDGTAPTSTKGHPLEPGDSLTVAMRDFTVFRAIRTGATSGVFRVTYWG